MTTPIYECVINKKTITKPIWLMRQAGRYLPEFKKIRKINSDFVNLCLTIKLLYVNYHSSSTISCFISFSLLVMMKLYNSFTVAYHSVKSDKMMSAYMSEFVSFNVLDTDYIKEKEEKELKQLEDNIPEDIDVSDIKVEEIIPVINKD